jgi:hypothetical protein
LSAGMAGIATNVRREGAPTPVTGKQLAELVLAQRHKLIVAVSRDGHRGHVVGASQWTVAGQARIWQALITAPSLG